MVHSWRSRWPIRPMPRRFGCHRSRPRASPEIPPGPPADQPVDRTSRGRSALPARRAAWPTISDGRTAWRRHEAALASASSRDGDQMTATGVETQRPRDVQLDQRTGRMLPTAVAVAGLWLAMALSSMFAPNLISNAQDHVPIVAITIWIWGAVATGFVLFGAAFPAHDRMARWGLTVAVLGIWGAVAMVSIFAPTIVSGDGTI